MNLHKEISNLILKATVIICCSLLASAGFTNEESLLFVRDVNQLDTEAAFSFSIMSDNHGAEPSSEIHMAKMNKWSRESGDEFIIGVGDQVSQDPDNDFTSYLVRDAWWYNHFYPTISDAENVYYGKGQSDWGAGGQMLKILNFQQKPNIEMRDNNTEYYTQIKVKEYTVHLIVLHYPDEPADIDIAFPADSRNYLINKLKSIQKGPQDIVIVSAHSRYGSWIDCLNAEQQKIIKTKCDLMLSGSTHYFERRKLDTFGDKGPLMVSAGSVNHARWGNPNGYIQVHVMKAPFALVVQYVNLDDNERKLQNAPFSFMKVINGEISTLDLSPLI